MEKRLCLSKPIFGLIVSMVFTTSCCGDEKLKLLYEVDFDWKNSWSSSFQGVGLTKNDSLNIEYFRKRYKKESNTPRFIRKLRYTAKNEELQIYLYYDKYSADVTILQVIDSENRKIAYIEQYPNSPVPSTCHDYKGW